MPGALPANSVADRTQSRTPLVLGLAAGLDVGAIEPFVHSLRSTGYVGRLGLVVAKYGARELNALRDLADLVWAVDDQYEHRPNRRVSRLIGIARARDRDHAYPAIFTAASVIGHERTALKRWQTLEFDFEGLQSLRYRHYYEAIVALKDVDAILLSDVRDVLFQTDPFAEPVAPLELFAEEDGVTIETEPYNGRWINFLYGPAVSDQLAGCPVSCSGTVIGTRPHVLNYLTEMTNEICWRRRPLGNSDQGVHNYLLHTGRLAAARLIQNGTGRVLTMGHVETFERDAQGRVLNLDGTIPAVLHQYDRHPALAVELLEACGA